MHGLRKMQISKRDAAQTEAHACQCVGQNAWVFLWDRECSASQVQIQPVKWHFMQHCHSLTCTPFYSDDWVLLPFNRHVSSTTHTHTLAGIWNFSGVDLTRFVVIHGENSPLSEKGISFLCMLWQKNLLQKHQVAFPCE